MSWELVTCGVEAFSPSFFVMVSARVVHRRGILLNGFLQGLSTSRMFMIFENPQGDGSNMCASSVLLVCHLANVSTFLVRHPIITYGLTSCLLYHPQLYRSKKLAPVRRFFRKRLESEYPQTNRNV